MSTENYNGGLFFLSGMKKIDNNNFNKEFRQPGAAVIFTSYRQHKVSPVIRGTRRTISYWARGPAWI
jgi:predicted 2-oxoglutarate/Fe(II)-dependent dioxygenase YbiX